MAYLIARSLMLMLFLLVVPAGAYVGQIEIEIKLHGSNPCQDTARGSVPHPTSCNVYYTCRRHRPTLSECPPYTLYEKSLKVCYPQKYVNCHANPKEEIVDFVPESDKAREKDGRRLLKTLKIALLRMLTLNSGKQKASCVPARDIQNSMFYRSRMFENKHYYISKDNYVNDKTSASICSSICGHLVEVNSAKKRDFLHDLINTSGSSGVLVSGYDPSGTGKWVHHRDATPIPYLPWQDRKVANKHCMAYKFEKNHFGLYRADCANRYAGIKYVCEVE